MIEFRRDEGSAASLPIVLVVVTYGTRWTLLERTLCAAFQEGVKWAVVVDNASGDNISERVALKFGDKIDVVSLKANTGSANGFKTGIEHALRRDAKLLLLLDDDNRPLPGALSTLRSAYEDLLETSDPGLFALVAFRPDHQPDIAAGVPQKRCYPRSESFFGFHVADIPYKLWRRMPWGRPQQKSAPPKLISIPHAPYSGLMFHRNLIGEIGLPNSDFVLYADDTEFTSRIVRQGGDIFLVTTSKLEDMEASWNTKTQHGSSFAVWLRGGSDFRAYYSARNQACYEQRINGRSVVYAINKLVYLAVLGIQAIWWSKWMRYELVIGAIRDGKAGRLGMSPRFPLV